MNNFETHIKGAKPVVVDFFAEWCGPCKMMPPVLSEVKKKIGDTATIQGVPTLIIFKEGKIIWRNAGVTQAKEIIAHLK